MKKLNLLISDLGIEMSPDLACRLRAHTALDVADAILEIDRMLCGDDDAETLHHVAIDTMRDLMWVEASDADQAAAIRRAHDMGSRLHDDRIYCLALIRAESELKSIREQLTNQ